MRVASRSPPWPPASGNALGHCAEAPCTPRANPVSTLAALEGARLAIAGARPAGEPDRDALALGALLAGYAIDAAGYGLHHVLSQTLVRVAGAGHGPANAVLLPHTLGALAWRFPDAARRARPPRSATTPPRRRRRCGRGRAPSGCATSGSRPTSCRAAQTWPPSGPDLAHTPPAAGRAELLALYEAAW